MDKTVIVINRLIILVFYFLKFYFSFWNFPVFLFFIFFIFEKTFVCTIRLIQGVTPPTPTHGAKHKAGDACKAIILHVSERTHSHVGLSAKVKLTLKTKAITLK